MDPGPALLSLDGTLLPTAFGAALFLGAAAGHAVLVIASHNRWYGSGLSRRVVDAMQMVHFVLLLAGPVALLGLAGGLDPRPLLDAAGDGPAHAAAAGYLVLCWAVGFVVFPAVTLWRRLRARPAALLSNHTETVDVAARLGYKPLGRAHGLSRLAARLPGNQVFTVDLAERTLRLERLPAEWDGLTVLHLSDVHFCGTPDRAYFQHVMDLCAGWEPDIVAFTGDLVDTEAHYRWVVPVLGRLRWRVAAFAILGNHDWYFEPPLLRRRLRKLGMHVLGNSWTRLEVRGQPLVVVGHEGPWFEPPPDLSDCPGGPFRLCLSHTPDNIAWARRHGIDLVLAGHVHGGQCRLPLIGSVVVPSRYGRRYDCGTFHESPTVMHVSRGLGGEQPLRYNCRPEVTRLVLRCATAR
jgi:predicted MPP superfamily phosphohydrolase